MAYGPWECIECGGACDPEKDFCERCKQLTVLRDTLNIIAERGIAMIRLRQDGSAESVTLKDIPFDQYNEIRRALGKPPISI